MQRVNTSKQELDFDLYWRISMSVTWDPLPSRRSRRSYSSRFVCRCCPHLTALFQTDCNLLTQDAKFLCCVQCTVPETWVLPLSLGRAGGSYWTWCPKHPARCLVPKKCSGQIQSSCFEIPRGQCKEQLFTMRSKEQCKEQCKEQWKSLSEIKWLYKLLRLGNVTARVRPRHQGHQELSKSKISQTLRVTHRSTTGN